MNTAFEQRLNTFLLVPDRFLVQPPRAPPPEASTVCLSPAFRDAPANRTRSACSGWNKNSHAPTCQASPAYPPSEKIEISLSSSFRLLRRRLYTTKCLVFSVPLQHLSGSLQWRIAAPESIGRSVIAVETPGRRFAPAPTGWTQPQRRNRALGFVVSLTRAFGKVPAVRTVSLSVLPAIEQADMPSFCQRALTTSSAW